MDSDTILLFLLVVVYLTNSFVGSEWWKNFKYKYKHNRKR